MWILSKEIGTKVEAKIKILHVLQRFYPRGAEVFAAQLAGALSGLGHENVMCALYEAKSDDFPFPQSVVIRSLSMNEYSIFAKLGLQPSMLLKLLNVYQQIKPNIVISHGADTLRYTSMIGFLQKQPLIIYRNIDIASFWARSKYKVWLYKLLLKKISLVASVSEVSRKDFLRCYDLPLDKVIAIPNGVDLSQYKGFCKDQPRKLVRDRLGLSEDCTVLINVGNLCYQKNQEELLRLMQELDYLPLHLILVGDGPKKHEFSVIVKKSGLENRVTFTGTQSNILPFLAAADIFVLPSRTEGMPAVLIEAGASGLPSIAYDVGGVSEVIKPDTGIVVSKGNFEELKKALISLVQNSDERQSMGKKAKQSYPDMFDIQVIARQYNNLITKLVDEGRRR